MGYNFANDLANETSLPLEQQLAIHFSANCYPPIPQFMIPVAVEAINAYSEYDGSKVITLPAGVTFRDSKEVTGFEVIEHLRLEAFVIQQRLKSLTKENN